MKAVGIRRQVQVCIGKTGLPVGSLTYFRQGQRENSAFAYDETWISNPARFNVSADLQLMLGYQHHKAASSQDSPFHGAIADTAPDAWGRRVIARAHARRRKDDPRLPAFTELDYLLAVDDFSRVGALRLRGADGRYYQATAEGRHSTPALIELERIFRATHALERGQETAEDLRYLQGKGTSLGGMRPKCTLLDENGRLAIGKFPSVSDTRSVTCGEVLALRLAQRAGIEAAPAHIVQIEGVSVAVIKRFDRDDTNGRIPYQSASTLLQAGRDEERSYTEIADAIRTHGYAPVQDIRQLWRRLVFNLLITNVDDHLQNHGFLHVDRGLWRLAPAFDINPFPDKFRESKTWLSEEDGPITDLEMLLARCARFSLDTNQALMILGEIHAAVSKWKQVALDPAVGLRLEELDDFSPAFEHEQMEKAAILLR